MLDRGCDARTAETRHFRVHLDLTTVVQVISDRDAPCVLRVSAMLQLPRRLPDVKLAHEAIIRPRIRPAITNTLKRDVEQVNFATCRCNGFAWRLEDRA